MLLPWFLQNERIKGADRHITVRYLLSDSPASRHPTRLGFSFKHKRKGKSL
ncbi:unnamed protein product [Linum tenue]|uniref:Uncharacterized protein n=1 Tax=Linum tenue TaxID=586396 RepID=A0AAV0QR65_9ROSI|nr:unnamed protein product [Linum tenue]